MDACVKQAYQQYPAEITQQLLTLRTIIFDVASEAKLGPVQECLKWQEPSYISKHGSTLRLGWKPARPHHYFAYVNCKTQLIATYKALYPTELTYEGNRAIAFSLGQRYPTFAIKHCFELALTYHRVKDLPLLGA
ncbi:MAG TPA: DUF1801 domain-containing protein [Marinagarivorans sp.]